MKKLSFLLAAIAFSVASFLVPVIATRVFASTPQNANDNYGSIQFNASGIDGIQTSFPNVNNASSATVTITDSTNTSMLATVTFSGSGLYAGDNNTIYANGTVSVAAALPSNVSYTASFWSDGVDQHGLGTSASLARGVHKNIDLVFDTSDSGEPSGPSHNPDDTNAWFIWNCNGDLCRYKITDLEHPFENPFTQELTYITKYIKSTDVKDANDNTKVLDLNTLLDLAASTPGNALAPYLFIYDDCIQDEYNIDIANTCAAGISSVTTWSGLSTWLDNNIYNQQDPEEAFRLFAIDPTGASSGANIISTNGDRRFRATIYDASDYYGISNASSPADLTYYPSYWDQTFFNPAYDISGTSLDEPMTIQAYLLEPKIYLSNDSVSASDPIASIAIASSNVPASAVTITKEGSVFSLEFNSNYYDNVTFLVTSTSGKTYYVAISRSVIGHVLDPIEQDKRNVGLFVPETDNTEYDILATYYWADGTEKTFTMEEMMLGGDGGKGLAMRPYQLKAADASQIDIRPTSANPPIGVSYIVVEQGSTTTTFKGALSGSGKGTYYRIVDGSYVLDATK